jgi:hypothetical protein
VITLNDARRGGAAGGEETMQNGRADPPFSAEGSACASWQHTPPDQSGREAPALVWARGAFVSSPPAAPPRRASFRVITPRLPPREPRPSARRRSAGPVCSLATPPPTARDRPVVDNPGDQPKRVIGGLGRVCGGQSG